MTGLMRCCWVGIAVTLLAACTAAGGDGSDPRAAHRGFYLGGSGGVSAF